MCGIVGYTGPQEAAPILLAGLRRLEYRGYDSAGVATLDGAIAADGPQEDGPGADPGGIARARARARDVRHGPHPLGHPRAAHRPERPPPRRRRRRGRGRPQRRDREPRGAAQELESEGFRFVTQTDTEVVAHLIARELRAEPDLFAAVQRVLPHLEGTYGLAVVSPKSPGLIVGARLGSPLVVGVGEGEHYLASDSSAIAPAHGERRVPARRRGRPAHAPRLRDPPPRARADHARGSTASTGSPTPSSSAASPTTCRRRSTSSPNTVRDASRGRLRRAEATAQFGGLNLTNRQLRRVRRVVFAACGTSWHAALVGEYLIERLAHLPVEVEYASEFRYRNAPLDDRTLVFVLSQSGETADTLGAMREAKRRGSSDAGDRQHRRQHDRPRGRRRHLPPRRPRGRRGEHQGVLGAGDGPDPAGPPARPAASPALHRRPGRDGRDRARARVHRRRAGQRARRDRGGRGRHVGPQRPLPGPRPPLPGRAGRGLEAQGDQLPPRRGLSHGRDEARPDRADRPPNAQRLRRPSRALCTPRR